MAEQRNGEWRVLDVPHMPRDAKTDFISYPTCLGVATLACIRDQYCIDDRRLDAAITGASKRIQKRRLWLGNGYDRYRQMCNHIAVFEMGGLIEYWKSNPSPFGKINCELKDIAASMLNNPEFWTGSNSGFHAISGESYRSTLMNLKPLIIDDMYSPRAPL